MTAPTGKPKKQARTEGAESLAGLEVLGPLRPCAPPGVLSSVARSAGPACFWSALFVEKLRLITTGPAILSLLCGGVIYIVCNVWSGLRSPGCEDTRRSHAVQERPAGRRPMWEKLLLKSKRPAVFLPECSITHTQSNASLYPLKKLLKR